MPAHRATEVKQSLIPHRDKWTGNKTIYELSNTAINPKTTVAPAMADFGGALLTTYKAFNSDLISQCLYDGKTWSQDVPIKVAGHPIGTNDSTALAVFNDTLYMAYRSSAKISGKYPIMLATLPKGVTDPTKWLGDKAIVASDGSTLATDHAPSLTVYDGGKGLRLWLGWQKDSKLYTAQYDGTTWINNGAIPSVGSNGQPESNYGPAIAAYDGSLWVIFKGRHSNDLMWATYTGSTNIWAGNSDIEVKHGVFKTPGSNHPPSVAVMGDAMYLVYKDAHDNDIRQAVLHEQVWKGNRKISETSDVAPQTDAYPGLAMSKSGKKQVLVMANKGVGSSDIGVQVYVSELS